MDMQVQHVPGEDRGKVMLYAISTCMWCSKAKRFLNKLGVEYYFVDVDLLPEDQKDLAKQEVIRWKKRAIYPLIVVNNKESIPVFSESHIRQALGL